METLSDPLRPVSLGTWFYEWMSVDFSLGRWGRLNGFAAAHFTANENVGQRT